MAKYDHASIEAKWQQRWMQENAFLADEHGPGEKVYVLDMFPYPSGDGLHVGHPEGYTATDILSRYLRMKGKNVLHPMGWDAFGLPAENAAIKKGIHPRLVTESNIKNFKRQIQSLGFSYDWSREVNTTDPAYYRWTQWIFLQLYKQGLAYEAELPIWWCPKDKTGLANEEVVDGACDRCGSKVEKKQLRQWVLKITKYADRLLSGLDKLDWPESIKTLQRNWIGRSEGAEINFPVQSDAKEKPLALLIHGCPRQAGYEDETKRHWWPSTVKALSSLGYEVIQPAMPQANAPLYETWKTAVEAALNGRSLNASSVAIGHSCGSSFLARFITEQKIVIGSLAFVAPAKIAGTEEVNHDRAMADLFDFTPAKQLSNRTVVFYSRNDDPRHVSSAKYYGEVLGADMMEFSERKHFTAGSGVTEIPELIEWISTATTIRAFTTRPDTIFGATYLVLAPEHALVDSITTKEQSKVVTQYKKDVANKSDLERTSLDKEKTGVFTGAYAINPATKKKIPVWIADYVVANYGTGAIMAVPAHDERDHEFAKKFDLPIVPVVKQLSVIPQPVVTSAGVWGTVATDIESACWTGEGAIQNSGQFDGMASTEARQKIVAWLEGEKQAVATVQYKLRDWIFSRQRYWGEPIPLVHCEKDGVVAIPEEQLPVLLPDVERYEPTGTGESPLAAIDEWVNTACPTCGGPAKRETNTMPQWAGSCWYYLRYLDPNNQKQLADSEKLKSWLPVDVYVGGAEHAVLHLMYARFWHKVLFDIGALPPEVGDEPFMKLKNQGLILGEDGEKMSKSRGNVINPDEIVEKFGADALRMFEMFMGPFEDAKPWSTQGIVGVRRFLERVWMAQERLLEDSSLPARTHQYIASISEAIEQYKFNTCVSDFMKWTNEWKSGVGKAEFAIFLKTLSPFAPHLSEELWSLLGMRGLLSKESWPVFDAKQLKKETATFAIQVNGKLRGTMQMPTDAEQGAVDSAARQVENVKKYLTATPKKIIFVPNKLINFIV